MQKYTLLRKKYIIDKNAFIDFLRNKKSNNKKNQESWHTLQQRIPIKIKNQIKIVEVNF